MEERFHTPLTQTVEGRELLASRSGRYTLRTEYSEA
jgi:hypothetical protein